MYIISRFSLIKLHAWSVLPFEWAELWVPRGEWSIITWNKHGTLNGHVQQNASADLRFFCEWEIIF